MSQVVCSATLLGTTTNTVYDDYYTCRNATSSGLVNSTDYRVGQISYYQISRGFIYFDTSGIPANAIITAAIIHIGAATNDHTYGSFNIIVRGASSASNPVVEEDYNLTHYNGDDLGELTTLLDYDDYTLNNNGRAYINRAGITQFVFLSEEDINNSPPTEDEYVTYSNLIETTLTITYYEPTEAPTVTTIDNACKDRQSTTLTATGNITGSGDGYTFRGFEYYEKGADLEYESSMYAVREIGAFHTLGQFEMTLYGLKPLTVYYIRAFAGNIFGIAFGEWVLCMTTEVPSYGIYTATNTAKYRLYVSDDEAIAWRGYKGPYSGKQTLINITDITNLTKGIKVLKILPDSKGTFHVTITIKEEIKS